MIKHKCRHCGAIDKHWSFQCPQNRKPIKRSIMEEYGGTSNKPLQSTKKRKPINKQSDKQKKINAAYTVLRKEFIRHHPVCEFRTEQNGDNHWICGRPTEEIHHVQGRGIRTLDTTTWLPLCAVHHHWIENNREESYKLGYLKSRTAK